VDSTATENEHQARLANACSHDNKATKKEKLVSVRSSGRTWANRKWTAAIRQCTFQVYFNQYDLPGSAFISQLHSNKYKANSPATRLQCFQSSTPNFRLMQYTPISTIFHFCSNIIMLLVKVSITVILIWYWQVCVSYRSVTGVCCCPGVRQTLCVHSPGGSTFLYEKVKGKGNCIAVTEHHVTATECHLPQCYLLPDTSERTPPSPQPVRPVLDLPTPEG